MLRRPVVVRQDPLGGAIEIFVLAALELPQEQRQPGDAEATETSRIVFG
ncbi:hypothetical protein [Microvirga sp. c23x22]|uniref:Uncharacterized protein n=1 Tax=Microvirga terricola TaxID=2719797 RepID=A0ABX0V896_9HYPH|nr:hypothetical protein [Microvirga terricola]